MTRSAIIACMLLSIYSGCTQLQDPPVKGGDKMTQEQMAVYSGLLESISSTRISNLANKTIPFDPGDIQVKVCVKELNLEDFPRSTHKLQLFPAEFSKRRGLTLVDRTKQLEILDDKQPDSKHAQNDSSDPQHSTTAPSESFMEVSEIVFDKTHEHAVVRIDIFVCGSHCRTSQTLVLEKASDKWKVRGRPCKMTVD